MTGNTNSGRRPMPSAWRAAHGHGQPPPLVSAIHPPPTEEPKLPDDISEDAQYKWLEVTDIMRTMGTLSVAYSDLLRLYCQTWDTYQKAYKRMHSSGLVVVNKKSGAKKASPYALVVRQAQQNLVRMQTELGLTPSAKSRLVVPSRKEVSARNRKA